MTALNGKLKFTAAMMAFTVYEHEPWLQIADVSVEVATVDHALRKLQRKYRKTRRKPKGLKRLWMYLLNIPHLAVIVTAVVFVVVVIIWTLLWVFICK